jgi:hypothetical protein
MWCAVHEFDNSWRAGQSMQVTFCSPTHARMDADHWIIEHTSLYVFTGILRLCRVAEDTDSERRDSAVRCAVVLVPLHAIEAHRGTRVSCLSDEDMFHSATVLQSVRSSQSGQPHAALLHTTVWSPVLTQLMCQRRSTLTLLAWTALCERKATTRTSRRKGGGGSHQRKSSRSSQ